MATNEIVDQAAGDEQVARAFNVVEKSIDRHVRYFEFARRRLALSACEATNVDFVSASLVLAARLEELENALISGLPTAGEGI